MNSQELKCFVVAADRLNFTRAAKELYVTPPTVTHHIQHLEEELGVKLFIRNSKSVQLTNSWRNLFIMMLMISYYVWKLFLIV